MSLSRMLAGAALLIAGVVVIATPACVIPHKFENGEDCIKDDECESSMCVQTKCMARNGDACWRDSGCPSGKCDNGHCKPLGTIVPVTDSGADTTPVPDGAPVDSGTDTTPADTTPATDTAASDADDAG